MGAAVYLINACIDSVQREMAVRFTGQWLVGVAYDRYQMSRGQGLESDGAERLFDKSMLGLGCGVGIPYLSF